MIIDLSIIWTSEQLRRAVDRSEKNRYYFSPGAMRFFRSRLAPGVLHTDNGLVFITSEQYSPTSPRLYTLRLLKEDETISTLGEFQQYPNLRAARKAAKDYMKPR